MRQRKPIKKDYDVWIDPITFDHDMLLRFKQEKIKWRVHDCVCGDENSTYVSATKNIVNNRTINNESTISRTTAIESSAMESSLFEVINPNSIIALQTFTDSSGSRSSSNNYLLEDIQKTVPFVTPLSVKGTKKVDFDDSYWKSVYDNKMEFDILYDRTRLGGISQGFLCFTKRKDSKKNEFAQRKSYVACFAAGCYRRKSLTMKHPAANNETGITDEILDNTVSEINNVQVEHVPANKKYKNQNVLCN
ncbi:hypothetical protein BDC45DRAFT_558263 [Circinella umbellata]|nr:hypothetical protein BDC45DRAFT_558263 [Circinella umbellata]